MLDNQTLQDKYPHLEVSVSPLSKVKKHFILGSDFNSNTREETLSNIKSEYKVSDYFDLINATISQIQEPYYIYDLTHSLGNFLQDVELIQNKLGSNKKQVKKDDLIISRLRSYLQEIAVVQQKKFKQLVSTEYLVYRPKTELISSNTLMVFALTKSVQTILSYSQYGTEHPRFYEFVFDEMPIPKVILELNHHIDSMIKEAYKAIESSKALYKEAEALLYEALGLDSKNPLQSILNTHANRSSVIARSEMTKQSIYRNIDCHKFDKLNSCNDEAVSPNYTIATLRESFLKTGRLDAEYYQSKYEDIEAKIHNFPTIKLKDLVQYPITSGATPKAGGSDYTDSKNGIPFLRAVDLKNARVDIANLLYIKPETHAKSLKRTKLIKGDVLFSIAGVIGRCAIFDYDFEANINQALAILRFTESKGIKRLYLIAFFNSQFGQIYLERYSRQGLQTNLNLDEVGNLEIPIIDSTTQAQIAAHIQKSFELRAEAKSLLESAKSKVESTLNNANNGGGGGKTLLEQIKAKLKESKRFYRLAQWLLIETLCFNDVDFTPCDKANILDLQVWSSATHTRQKFDKSNSRNDKTQSPNYTIRTLANSLKESGRLDAEYYQSKYEKNEALLKSLPHKRLHELVDIYKSIEPGSNFYKEKGLPFVRVSNLSKFGVGKSEVYLDSKDFAKESLQSLYPKKDDVLLSKDGSVGIAYAVENDLECVLSGAILRLKIKDKAEIKAKYLSLVLNALTTQLQAQRDCGGSIIAHWRLEEIQNLIIPLLDFKTQEAIESKISQSFALKAKSKELLESAKQRVEEAIVSKKI